MSEMGDIIKTALDGIKAFTDIDTVVGNVIDTPSGVTIIPISKITVGFAGGGLDYNQKKSPQTNFGSASGTGISITPIAFLTVGTDSSVKLIQLNKESDTQGKLFSFLEKSPEIIERIKSSLS